MKLLVFLLLLCSCAAPQRTPSKVPSSRTSVIESFNLSWHDFKINIFASPFLKYKKIFLSIQATDSVNNEVFLYRDSIEVSDKALSIWQPELELKNGIYFVHIEISDPQKKNLFKDTLKREITDSPL